MPADFPSLPIVTPDPPRRSEGERYGALFYLGAGGLVVLVALIGWFAWGAWTLRDVWSAVYVLNDPNRPEPERVAAAEALARDPRVNSRQLWDLSLSRVPPGRARYILAEALTAEAIEADPSGYALAVARSEGWPDWLRLLLMRPMAYDDGRHGLPPAPLAELRVHRDPAIALWAAYIQAVARRDREAAEALGRAADRDDPTAPLASLLLDALRADSPAGRRASLDRATAWLRAHHPDALRVLGGSRLDD